MIFFSMFQWILNCAISSPFQKSSKIAQYNLTPDSIVTVALTEVDIYGSYSDKSTFWDRVSSVRSSLEENDGYLASAIRKEIFGSRAWTMTIWKNDEALEQFIYSRAHERAMKDGAPAVKNSKFYRSQRTWKELPMAWEVVEKLIYEEGRME